MIKSNVKKIMELKNVKVKPFAEKYGLSHLTILSARDDNKIINCKLITLDRIARALGVSVKDLFDDQP
ncbi:MAG: helix-turn-helix transcriptional regulator [Desulfoplanes sp.]|nr:helix-turn-helix transcriptional regulator [Desulfoplanes sp.]